MKQTLNPVIELPKNCSGYVFKIANTELFNELFVDKVEPVIMYNNSGEEIVDNIASIMVNAKQTGRINMMLTSSYSDEHCALFRLKQMEQDEFGAVILWYEYENTIS